MFYMKIWVALLFLVLNVKLRLKVFVLASRVAIRSVKYRFVLDL